MSRTTSLATHKQHGDAEELCKRVQIDQLIDRLIAHVCSPKPIMDESQVQLDTDSPLAIPDKSDEY